MKIRGHTESITVEHYTQELLHFLIICMPYTLSRTNERPFEGRFEQWSRFSCYGEKTEDFMVRKGLGNQSSVKPALLKSYSVNQCLGQDQSRGLSPFPHQGFPQSLHDCLICDSWNQILMACRSKLPLKNFVMDSRNSRSGWGTRVPPMLTASDLWRCVKEGGSSNTTPN